MTNPSEQTSLLIQKAVESDARAIFYLTRHAMLQYGEQLDIACDKLSFNSDTLDRVRDRIINHHVFVAKHAKTGEIIGSLCLAFMPTHLIDPYLVASDEPALYMSRFAVMPALRGTGIGNRLLDAVRAFSIEHHVRCLYLHTCAKPSSLYAFYEKRGFQCLLVNDDNGYPRGLWMKAYPTTAP